MAGHIYAEVSNRSILKTQVEIDNHTLGPKAYRPTRDGASIGIEENSISVQVSNHAGIDEGITASVGNTEFTSVRYHHQLNGVEEDLRLLTPVLKLTQTEEIVAILTSGNLLEMDERRGIRWWCDDFKYDISLHTQPGRYSERCDRCPMSRQSWVSLEKQIATRW